MKQFLFFAAFLLGMMAYSCQKDSLSTAVSDHTDLQVFDRDSTGGHHGGGHHGGGHHHNGDSTHTNHPHDSTHVHPHDSTHVHPHDSTHVHPHDSTHIDHPHDSIPGGGHPHHKHHRRG